jgi:hypothetical protein
VVVVVDAASSRFAAEQMSGVARSSRVVRRFAVRAVGATTVARLTKRYPLVGVLLVVWRWWRRRQARVEHTSLRLRRNDVITITDKAKARGI